MTSVAVHCVVLLCACKGHLIRDEFCSCTNNSKSILKSTSILEKQSKSEIKPTYAHNCVYFRKQSYGRDAACSSNWNFVSSVSSGE